MHPDPGQRVERAERLVGEQQFRFPHQGSRQRRPLRLAAGELVRPGPCPSGATYSPAARSRSIPSGTVRSPKPRVSPRIRTAGAASPHG
jgi:hypothetical protein